jgi:[acyl-carrier-protein] S-malonyltransferase
LSFADAVRTVRNRGKYMQEGVPVGVGAMAAVLALASDKVHQLCAEAAQGEICQAANLNSPDQTVISGSKAAVERAAELAKQRGAKRAIMLPVSAPFHCALMQPAQDRLAADLAALTFHDPTVPVMCNVDASLVTTAEQARDALIRQVTGSVQWEKSMRSLVALGVKNFVEIGPGKVLCGLMRQIDRAAGCTNVDDEASLQKTMNHLSPASTKPD